MTDLIYNLRSLAALEHADLSVADEAADEIERLRAERDMAMAALKRIKEARVFLGAIAQEMMNAALGAVRDEA